MWRLLFVLWMLILLTSASIQPQTCAPHEVMVCGRCVPVQRVYLPLAVQR